MIPSSGRSKAALDQIKRFVEGRPYRMQIECAVDCPNRCTYCHSPPVGGSRPLDADEIKRLLKEASEVGVIHVEWMGGDPLEREDWAELLTFARHLGMINHVWTTGVHLLSVCTCKSLIELTREGTITLRIDSLDTRVLSRLRDPFDEDVHGRALKGLGRLLEAGKPREDVGNAVMVTREHTVDDVLSTVRQLKREYGITTKIMPLKPLTSRARALIPDRSFFDDLTRVRSAHPPILRDCPMHYCATTFFIDIAGNLARCHALREPLGSVREAPLPELIARRGQELFFARMREYETPNRCQRCSEVRNCWGCRANAYYHNGDMYSSDPFCRAGPVDTCSEGIDGTGRWRGV